MKKRKISFILIVIISIFFISSHCYSQTGSDKSRPPIPLPIQSPEVSSLFKFSEPGVNLYKGQASISVPIYTIKLKSQSIPVSLQYTASGVKPNQQPGWLGVNWSLSAGGSIQLEVKGARDYNDNYRPLDPSQVYGLDDYFDYSDKNGSVRNHTDFTKDQYSFSFNGYSGKIYFDRDNKIYCSNPELKIEVGDGALADPSSGKDIGMMFGFHPNIFKITAKDGTMYYFGDIYQDRMKYPQGDPQPISWLLYKIITPSNEHVNFDYTLNESTNSNIVIGMNTYYTQFPDVTSSINLSQCTTLLNGSMYDVFSHPSLHAAPPLTCSYSLAVDKVWSKNHAGASISTSDEHVFLIPNLSGSYSTTTPMESILGYYTLKSISTDDETIEFNKAAENGDSFRVLDPLTFRYFITNSTQDLSRQPTLNEIKIYKKINNVSNCFKRFELDYNSFALTSVREFDNAGKSLEPYTFDYYYPMDIENLIKITSAIDHWGFYNGMDQRPTNLSSLLPVYDHSFADREPLEIALKKTRLAGETDDNINSLKKRYLLSGTLKKATYPTKGYTRFYYDQNDFSAMVNRTLNTNEPNEVVDLNEGNLPAGGIKVTRIVNVATAGDSIVKEYKYIKDYLKSSGSPNNYTINSENKSSGILSGNVNYYMQFSSSGYSGLDITGNSSSCMGGDYLGYSEVAEIVNGTNVTIHQFSDFKTNPDVNPSRTATYTTISGGWGVFNSSSSIRLSDNDDLVLKQNSQESHQHERGKELITRKFKNNQSWYSLAEEKDFEYGYNESLSPFDPISIEVLETNAFDVFSDKFSVNEYIPRMGIFTEDWASAYEYKADNAYETSLDENNEQVNSPIYDHNSYIMLNKLKYIFGDYVLQRDDTKTYPNSNSSEYIETVNTYEYSKYSQLIKQETSNSNDIPLVTINTYTDGQASTVDEQWKNTMFNKHMVGIPYISETCKWPDYGGVIVNSEQTTEFKKEPNYLGFPLPSTIYEFHSPDGNRLNGTSEPVMEFDDYSSNGNLLQYHKVNDIDNSFIWSEEKNSGDYISQYNFNGNDNSITGMFGDGADQIFCADGKLELNSGSYEGLAVFLIPTYFKTGDQNTKFTVSLDYSYNGHPSFRPKDFTIFLAYSEQSISDIVRSQPYKSFDYAFPGDLITSEFNPTTETQNVTNPPFVTLDKEITLTDYSHCNKYLYIYISLGKFTNQPGARFYIDNLKITKENIPSNEQNSNGKYLLAKVENAQHKDITYTISEDNEIKLSSINVSTPNARITRYTYDPVFGIKSIIDPNGKITYYEYDSFGRLKLVKDDQDKILKKYDYHYSNQ